MIFKDRIPSKPNRYKVIPENSDPFYAEFQRADDPIQEGTPLNAENLNRLQKMSVAIIDSDVADQKDIPENALPYAEVTKLGGMTYKDGNTLKSATVTEIESVGVNLIPYPYIDTIKTDNGVTFTVNNDGSIGVKGTATANAVFYLVANKKINTLVGGLIYTPSTATSTTKTILMCNYIDSDGTTKNFTTSLKGAMQYPSTVKSDMIYLLVQNGTTVDETVYPMLNKGTTALPYAPYQHNTLPIPEAVQVLDGYGEGINENVYNYIDYEKKQFVKRVEKVDMGTIDWVYTNPFGTGVMCFKATAPNNAKLVGANDTSNVLCALFNTITANRMSRGDEGITTFATLNGIFINDSTYTDAATFSSAVSGVMLLYELAEPIIIDISDILTDDNYIGVEGNGTITFENEYAYDVPSDITFYGENNDIVGANVVVAKKIIADKIVSGWKLAGSVTGVTDINSTQISYPSAATELLIHGYIFGGNTFYFQFPIVLAPIGNGNFYIPQSQFIDSENYTNMVFRINNTSSKYVKINSHTEKFAGGGYPPSGIYVWVYYK